MMFIEAAIAILNIVAAINTIHIPRDNSTTVMIGNVIIHIGAVLVHSVSATYVDKTIIKNNTLLVLTMLLRIIAIPLRALYQDYDQSGWS